MPAETTPFLRAVQQTFYARLDDLPSPHTFTELLDLLVCAARVIVAGQACRYMHLRQSAIFPSRAFEHL
jgi:hypothetical protein